jgi:hypothetical protein
MLDLVHSIPGRIRLQRHSLRGNPRLFNAARSELEQVEGVTSVSANSATGSLVVSYDPRELSFSTMWRRLRQTGYMAPTPRMRAPRRAEANASFAELMAETVSRALIKKLIERSTGALI